MSVVAKMQLGPFGHDAKVVLELDVEGAQYIADVMDSEDSRTAWASHRQPGRGDLGAREIRNELVRVIEQIDRRGRREEDEDG